MAQHTRDSDEAKRRAQASASDALRARNRARGGSAAQTQKVQQPAARGRRAASGKSADNPTLGAYLAQNAVYIVAVAAVAAIVAVMLVAIRSCVPTETYDYDGELDFYYESPFDWANLQDDNGRLYYVDNGKVRSKLGVDVSENQGEIDWQAVADDGIDFAMIRLGYRGATEGVLHTDDRFWDNLQGAQEAGVGCGVYFFSQATNKKEAREEADYIASQLGGASLQYPVALDFESAVAGVDSPRASDLDKDAMTQIAQEFCARIEQYGYQSMVYGNYYDLNMYHYQGLQDKRIWWAEYDVWQPGPHLDICMWQYSNGGWVNGIQTAVDMNIDLSDALD